MLQRLGGIRCESLNDHGRRSLVSEAIGLPSPEVEAFRVACGAGGRPKWVGEVVHFWVGAGGLVAVLAEEAVADTAGGAAGEGAGAVRWVALPG